MAAAVGLLGLLLLIQTLSYGRIGLEKMLTEMAQPYGLLWIALTLGLGSSVSLWLRGGVRRPMWISLLGLWIAATLAGNRWAVDVALQQTQFPAAAAATAAGAETTYDVLIVLGGGIGQGPLGRPQLLADGDRIRPPLQLWHAGRVERILLTGSATIPGHPHVAELTAQLLIECGVSADAIQTVGGRNTTEEMAAIRKLVDEWGSDRGDAPGRVGLVTSAFHMPRALRLARRQGLEQLVPLPVAYRGQGERAGWARGTVPTAGALADLSLCWKEWMASAIGR